MAASSSDVHAGDDLGDCATPLSGTQLFTQVAAVVAWTIFYLSWNWSGLTPFDFGQRLYWLLPAVFVLLGSVGLFVFGRMPRQQRREPWAFRLLLSSLFAFAPLGWYAFMAFIGLLIGDFE